jgi:hypothetical protein
MEETMKRLPLLFFLLILPMTLSGRSLHLGFEGTFGISLGTGKGNWDWTQSELGIQRRVEPNPGVAALMLLDLGPVFQLEGGAGYFWNRSSLTNGDKTYSYRQDTLEFPLGLRLFLHPGQRGFYVKGGGTLFLLQENASYKNLETGEDLLASQASRKLHPGIQIGLGIQKEHGKTLWQTELKYLTFYSSPDYLRSDGSRADLRFHRMQLSTGVFY